MKYYKHDCNASADAKIKKLIMKHGALGYAVYFHCLELIGEEITNTKLTFELEHDAEIIADNLKILGTAEKAGVDIVGDIMRYIVELELFEESHGRIFCFKMLQRMDTSMVSNPEMRKMISNAKIEMAKTMDKIMTNHDKS